MKKKDKIPGQVNILLADDDEDDCFLFKEALKELPLSVNMTEVHNGEQLIQLLTSTTVKLPHILFLDLNMPRKNGFDCLSEIKSNKKLKNIPVVIFSTWFEEDIANQLYKSDTDFYIRKPTKFSELKEVIHQTIMQLSKHIFQQHPEDLSDQGHIH